MSILKTYQLKPYAGDVGIEIEVEGRDIPHDVALWRTEHDGSLRGECMEYITRKGVAADKVDVTLRAMTEAFKNSTVFDSARAGVHVHVNIQDMTHTQVASFATLYYIFENVLTEWCGGFRKGNLFCLRADDADYVLRMVTEAFQRRTLHALQTDGLRYSALNWKPSTMYGSLEFRQMRTPKDFSLVATWVKMLLQVKEASLRYKEPRDIISEWSLSTPEDFLNDHMGEYANALKFPDYEDKMLNGMFNAQDIAFCVDWDGYEVNFRANEPKRKKPLKMEEVLHVNMDNPAAGWENRVEARMEPEPPILDPIPAPDAQDRILNWKNNRGEIVKRVHQKAFREAAQKVVYENNQWKVIDKDEF